ncbi:MAG: uL13 family ribosomal protein [archaeon]
MYVINGKGKPLGRIASKAAEEAQKGKEVRIINAEKAIVVGKKQNIIQKYRDKFNLRDLGNPRKSPKTISRRPDLFVKRVTEKMLPMGKRRGKKAKKRIKAHLGEPEGIKKESDDKLEIKTDRQHITIKKLCEELGLKQ